MAVKPSITKRGRGRPAERVFNVDEVASLMSMPVGLIEARLRLGGFFPGATQSDGVWSIPERAVRHCLGCRVRPMFTIDDVASILGLNYHTVFKATAAVKSLDAPLPAGKSIRALLLFFGGTKPMKRVHEDELLRVQGLRLEA